MTVTPAVTPAVTRDATEPAGPSRPARLGARGRRLWEQMTYGAALSPAELVLVEEACRLADRLERFDRLLTGEAEDWLGIVESKGDPDRQELVINAPLAEARQHATALKQIIGELRQLRAASAGPARPGQPAPAVSARGSGAVGGERVGGVADLAARIAERRAQAAG